MKRKIELFLSESSEMITNLFQYYIYDMSEYTKFSPNRNGTFTVDESLVQLQLYWTQKDHFPYLIKVDGEIAGFSLLRKYPDNRDFFDIGQFFILRKFKNSGVGRKAFELSVKRHPGKWITRVLPNNSGAYSFWEKVITEISPAFPEIKTEFYKGKEMLYFYYEI
ncbi:MAG: GNAT family N-acetyltransferase [Spirochaetales bacterium]|nr:GNAT family N-acetyltransferase [Spirochaetales bacterium]